MRAEGGGSYKETARSTRHGCDLQSPLSFHKERMFLLGSEVEREPVLEDGESTISTQGSKEQEA